MALQIFNQEQNVKSPTESLWDPPSETQSEPQKTASLDTIHPVLVNLKIWCLQLKWWVYCQITGKELDCKHWKSVGDKIQK